MIFGFVGKLLTPLWLMVFKTHSRARNFVFISIFYGGLWFPNFLFVLCFRKNKNILVHFIHKLWNFSKRLQGRVDDLSFFEYLSPFYFSLIEFHCTFSISYKYYHILFIIIVFWLGCDLPSALLFFMLALLLSILTPLFLPSLSVSLSYFVLAVPMR